MDRLHPTVKRMNQISHPSRELKKLLFFFLNWYIKDKRVFDERDPYTNLE